MKLLSLTLSLFCMVAQATEYVYQVDTNLDDPNKNQCTTDADNDCSLRSAIELANAHTISGDSSIISLEQDTYTLTYNGTEGELTVGDDGTNAVNMTIQGVNQTSSIISGNHVNRLFKVKENASLFLKTITLKDGYAKDDYSGAAIYNRSGTVSLENCLVTDNHTAGVGSGGAIYSAGGENKNANITINNCTFTYNSAHEGGAIYNSAGFGNATADVTILNSAFSQNYVDGGAGGAIHSYAGYDTSTVSLLIKGSTFANNKAGLSGGAIYNSAGFDSTNAAVEITNSTFSENSADNSAAIENSAYYDDAKATLKLSHVTLSDNITEIDGNGAVIRNSDYGATTYLTNTIFNNAVANCTGTAIVSNDYNIANDATCNLIADHDQPDTNPQLEDQLKDNGGSTMTYALLPSSSAIDSGSCYNNDQELVDADQREVARLDAEDQPMKDGNQDGIAGCDIGAYEYDPAVYDLSVALYAGSKDEPVTTVAANKEYNYQIWTSVNGDDDDEYAAWGISQVFTLPIVDGVPLEVVSITSSGECVSDKEYITCDFINLDGESSLITTITVKAPVQIGTVLSSAAEVWYDANVYEQQDGQAATEPNSANNLAENSVTVVSQSVTAPACNKKLAKCNASR